MILWFDAVCVEEMISGRKKARKEDLCGSWSGRGDRSIGSVFLSFFNFSRNHVQRVLPLLFSSAKKAGICEMTMTVPLF